MQNNYYFLRQLSRSLRIKLEGYTLVSCFTQNKDELVVELNNGLTSFFIRADLSPELTSLSFPTSFGRAGRNSLDLFPETILKKVTGIRQFSNERSFALHLEGDLSLVFKMHATRANVILFEGNDVSALFRHHLTADLGLKPDALDREIDWSEETFRTSQLNLQQVYFTLGKQVWNHLSRIGFETASAPERWRIFIDFVHALESPEYFICRVNFKTVLLLFQEGDLLKTFSDPVAAINEFYSSAISSLTFDKEKFAALQELRLQVDRSESFLQKSAIRLDELLQGSVYKTWADLIMANMHSIKTGSDALTAENFYDNSRLINIPLRPTLNAQMNAEAYYRKARNQRTEIQKLEATMEAKRKERDATFEKIQQLEKEQDLKGLRKGIAATGLTQQREKQAAPLPYREFEFKGFKIWVGRNAESNDKLTQKHSFKDDLWLHAKDVAGSHVLIKYQSGKNYPKDMIEYAAELAAHFSKRKNESLCPVAFTQKKYVRKRKGDPAGAVVVEREEVILVTPAIL